MPDLLGPGAAGALNAVTSRPAFSPLNQAPADPDTWVRDCTSPIAADGTQDKAAHMNMLLAQLRNSIRINGIYENSADDFMLYRAMRAQRGNLGTIGGTANALTLTLAPTPVWIGELYGMPLRFIAAAVPTANVTMQVTGFGMLPIVRRGGVQVSRGAWRIGDLVEIMYDGTNFQLQSVGVGGGRLVGSQTFTSSGTYTPSPGMTICEVVALGGGGAGGGAGGAGPGTVSLGAPGASGTLAAGLFSAEQVGVAVSISIGAGGDVAVNAPGGNGGTTSFGALMSAPGGIGGGILNNQVPPTVNGNGALSLAASGANLYSLRGGADSVTVAVSDTTGYAGAGGSNPYGRGGPSVGINTTGVSGTGNGAGGSGCLLNQGGGITYGAAGTSGIVIIKEYEL